MTKGMVTGSISGLMDLAMKVTLVMEQGMAKAKSTIKVETYTRVNFVVTESTGMEYIHGAMGINTKGSGRMIRNMVTAPKPIWKTGPNTRGSTNLV